jgi:hypothetical protein
MQLQVFVHLLRLLLSSALHGVLYVARASPLFLQVLANKECQLNHSISTAERASECELHTASYRS